MLIDEKARIEATDPTLSCLLQAPAGSGKTEVLTQRFLRLLSRVQEPEHIVALTFTRKAANEMRERVLLALTRAHERTAPENAHQQKTIDYATEALAQDERRQWQLLTLPHRLRITTIDSLCQTLTHAMPLFEQNIPYANITDQPQTFYRKAASACFKHALTDSHYQPALLTLLKHFDNRQDKVIQILSDQLKTREQWLRKLFVARKQGKADFEKALALIETHEIERFKASVPPDLITQIMALSKEIAHIENNPTSPRFILTSWTRWEEMNAEITHGLSALLLTSQLTWRKGFDHHIGLRRDACDKNTFNRLKTESQALLETLSESPACLDALVRVRQLPSPFYPEPLWHTLQALLTLLPLLTAHLELIWQKHNCTDFTAIAAAAHQTLTFNDAPTDLALYLDNTIHHLLIDEFQDTSIQQFELISQLIEGFQDGKTIFLVGDPMQSIYRFRSAEVGLFLRAKHQGIGPIQLKFLQLECNFRANASLVQWINQHFQHIFPQENDLESGAIQFHSATAIHPEGPHAFIRAQHCSSKEEEAQHLLISIQRELADYPEQNIAILVRSRHQLSPLIRALRAANMPYQGIDIDWLSQLPHIQDVWSLTQCLLTPGSNLAWAAFLRSPWCGLSLKDLLTLSQMNPKHSLLEALANEETYQQLSIEGQIRARYCYDTLLHARLHRQQRPLAQWILNTLQALHLKALFTTREQMDIHEYLNLVERHEKDGMLSDPAAFKQAFNALYSKQTEAARIQIMTIHKAKGLEFDCVMLPGLSAKTSQTYSPLLRWLTLPSEADDLVLVSPLKAMDEDTNPLYDYLNKLDKEKELYEQQRLLYVAVTRAKSRLYLFDFQQTTPTNTFKHLLKHVQFETIEAENSVTIQESNTVHTSQLPIAFYQKAISFPAPSTQRVHFHIDTEEASEIKHQVFAANQSVHGVHEDSSTALIPNFAASVEFPKRSIGIATHRLLQWICTYHPQNFSEVPWNLAHLSLKQQGIIETGTLLQEIRTYLEPLFHTPRGRWIIEPHHNEHNEYELLVKEQEALHTRIIDRTFEDNGTCWIIDFKTGQPSPKHHQQIEAYAKHFSHLTSLPIRCGLYYLATATWVESVHLHPILEA